jgi:hypothetical protein
MTVKYITLECRAEELEEMEDFHQVRGGKFLGACLF